MVYATAADMCQWYGFSQMALLAKPDDTCPIPPNLLRSVVECYVTGNWTAEQEEAANQAVVRIDNALDAASRLADGYLSATQSLPLEPDTIAVSVLPRMVGDIARYTLLNSQEMPIIAQRYNQAIKWLEGVARGLVRLSNDPPKMAVGMPSMTSEPSIFSRARS